jgi:hypothetical protein
MNETLTIKLAFNPGASHNEVIRNIFSNETCAKLWTLWKRGHLVSQFFNELCISIASNIEAAKPQNAQELRRCFGYLSQTDFTDRCVDSFLVDHACYFLPGCPPLIIKSDDGAEWVNTAGSTQPL